jgi:hypothetical protein
MRLSQEWSAIPSRICPYGHLFWFFHREHTSQASTSSVNQLRIFRCYCKPRHSAAELTNPVNHLEDAELPLNAES